MFMKKIALLAVALAGMYSSAFAGGFKIGLQGQKQIGMAHVGIGLVQDAATVYFNPAGLSFIDNQVNAGVSIIVPRTQFLDANTNISTYAVNQAFSPFSLYASYALPNTPLSVGLGIYTPFGSGIKYPTNWTGRFVLTDISLQAVYFQPTIAYKVSDNLSLGAGFVYSSGGVILEKQIPLQSAGAGAEAGAALDGHANGWGYNLGAYFKAGENFSGGITYHSRVDMKVDDGTASFTNIPTGLAGSFPNTTFDTELPLPSELGVGVAYKLNKDLLLAVDMNYTFWNSFQSLGFDYQDNTDKLTDDVSPRNYENALAVRAGMQWCPTKRLALRTGIFYDQTPVQDEYVNPELPDNDKLGVTLGFSYWLEDRFSIDASLMYEDVARRKTLNTETQIHGTYGTKAIIPGIGLNYLFGKKVEKSVNNF